jgi:hypothetical protein
VELKLNGTHQLMVYADDVNLLEDNIATIIKITGTLTDDNFLFVTRTWYDTT